MNRIKRTVPQTADLSAAHRPGRDNGEGEKTMMNRKGFVLGLSLMMTAAAAVSAGAEESILTAGEYEATVPAMKGDMTVHVTVDETSVTDITVDTVDTRQVVGAVINELVPEILEKQSVNVDNITGATISSYALKSAVRDCLTQAGASEDDFNEAEEKEVKQGEDQQAQVVVVGSGAAGMSAAIQLKNNGVEDVIVLEKLGYLGGTSAHSSGGAWVVGGTQFNKNTGFDYTADELVAHMYASSEAEEGTLNDELIRNIAGVSAEVFNEYVEAGAPWDLEQYTFGDALNEMPVAWVKAFYDTPWESGAGVTLMEFMQSLAEDKGVEIRVNSKAASLLTDDSGAVTGVVVETPEEIYNLYTDKVVLATGGFQRNKELVEQIAPDYTEVIPFTGAGSTGDGIVMAQELGAYVVGNSIGGARGLDMRLGYQGPIGTLVWAVGPLVNTQGVRFAAENRHYSRNFEDILAQPDATVFGITDSTNPAAESFDQAVEMGYAFKADTLEEFGALMEVENVDAFAESITTYNEDYEAGNDDSVFGVAHDAMAPVKEAPFYAIRTKDVSSFCLSGLAVDGNCRILKEDGSVIENLYGAGELICGNLTAGYYTGSGSQVGAALYEGKIIADDIAG